MVKLGKVAMKAFVSLIDQSCLVGLNILPGCVNEGRYCYLDEYVAENVTFKGPKIGGHIFGLKIHSGTGKGQRLVPIFIIL